MTTYETKLRGARKRLREALMSEVMAPEDSASLVGAITAIDKLIAGVKPVAAQAVEA